MRGGESRRGRRIWARRACLGSSAAARTSTLTVIGYDHSSTRSNRTKTCSPQGGGNATASGVNFQALVGAIFASRLLAERTVDDRLRLAGARAISIRFETETPLDDILVETDASGWIFTQCKTTLSLSESLESEFGKTAEQIVRQWKVCKDGNGKRGWDRPLDLSRDRMVVAVGPGASGTITGDLAAGLGSLQAPAAAPPSQAQRQAVEKLKALLAASWRKLFGKSPATQDIDDILKLVAILQFDPTAADRAAAIEMLAHVTEEADAAPAAFATIGGECESLMAKRHGTNAPELRRVLARAGLRLRAAPSYRTDAERLRTYSEGVQSHLEQYEETKIDGLQIKIERSCTTAVVAAAKDGSLVLVGEPGAGKSAVISAAAQRLRTEGKQVLELAVDRLPVDSLEGLRSELELAHPLRDVFAIGRGVGVVQSSECDTPRVKIALALDHLQHVLPAPITDDIQLPTRRRTPSDPDLFLFREVHAHRKPNPVALSPENLGDQFFESVHCGLV